jgi:hypothetical protein
MISTYESDEYFRMPLNRLADDDVTHWSDSNHSITPLAEFLEVTGSDIQLQSQWTRELQTLQTKTILCDGNFYENLLV